MITKEQFIQSLVRELDIIKHLAGKVDTSKLDYRPTPAQRSTLELLQYLGRSIAISIKGNIAGDQNVYIELTKEPNTVTFENFISKMDEQIAFVKEAVGALTEADLAKESTIWGSTAPLAMHLLGVLKTATAYKMQLFLYIKMSGNSSIGTSNVWGGMDMPAKV
jgi:hypothetical protein